MAVITKSGKPRSTTPASIGDIYIDSDTGAKYRCTFSYKDNYGASTYTWKEIESGKVVETEKPKESEKPDDKVEEPAENEKSDDAVKEPAKPQQPQRFNYNQQYNKHKR